MKGQKVYTETKYNQWGQVAQSSNPHYSTSDLLWSTYEYLATGAVKKVISPTATIEYSYNGRIITTNNTTLGIQTSKEANAIGQVVKATDPGGSIDYTYYSSGQPKAITAGGATTRLYYDAAGYQEKLIEPDAGTILYDYNPFGELISQTNANLHTYKMTYDGLGRLTNKTLEGSLDDNTSYTYCPEGTHGFSQLQTVSGSNGIQTSYIYDNKSRVIEKNQLIDGKKYGFTYDYNVYGKVRNVTWPTGFSIKYRYKNGYLSAVEENSTGNKLWDLTDINARGQVTQFQLGNGLLTTKGYDDVGFPTTIFTEGGVQDLEYNFNIHSGNLNWRKAVLHPPYGSHTLTENFTYDEDGLNNRLMTWQVAGGTQYSVDYAANGNMNTKTGVGTYLYGTGDDGSHAVSRIKDPDPAYLAMAKLNKQEVTYTGFDKTATIRQYNPANQEQASALEITYGPGQSRRMTKLYKAEGLIKTKIFVDGIFETEEDANGNLRQLHYLSGGDGLFAIYVIDQDGNAAMNYIHKDYQGSFETITNHKGAVVERLSFDPWGRRRNATDWTFNGIPETYMFDRGYTGHEHLDVFELINMNGRIYDPRLGRFMSPDPFVQSPTNTQNYNRYSYCINNPLKYTDPSGYSYKPDDWDGKITVYAPYFGPGLKGPIINWVEHTNYYSFGQIVDRLETMPSGSSWTPEGGFEVYKGDDGGLSVGIAYQNYHSSWNNTVARSESAYVTEYNNIQMQNQANLYGFIAELNNIVLNAATGFSFSYWANSGGDKRGFPEKFYSYDANKGDVYVTNQDVINIFGKSCQPVEGTITLWGVALYEIFSSVNYKLPNGLTAPILVLQVTLQMEDWRRENILMDYNNYGGGQGLIMRYNESIQDWNGYLHIDRNMKLIDAANGRDYGTYGQNYMPH